MKSYFWFFFLIQHLIRDLTIPILFWSVCSSVFPYCSWPWHFWRGLASSFVVFLNIGLCDLSCDKVEITHFGQYQRSVTVLYQYTVLGGAWCQFVLLLTGDVNLAHLEVLSARFLHHYISPFLIVSCEEVSWDCAKSCFSSYVYPIILASIDVPYLQQFWQ